MLVTARKAGLRGAILVALLCAALPARAQESTDAVDFEEHLGAIVPADITLIDEDGNPVTLGEMVDRPTILNFVYFECPGICTPLLTEIADILGKSTLDPAKQPFRILSVSFNADDTPVTAKAKRANYLSQLSRPLPDDVWRFMTASQADIERLTGAAGFHYKRAGKEFVHPGGLILLSPDRKIVRYLYGTEFLPFDFEMGVYEAAQGNVTPTTARLLRFCFSYDPEGRTYVFNLAKVVAVVMLTSVAFFIVFLVFSTRFARRKES
ncbi:MAG TPA: SCO family protein [Candidatus Krumholzibacteria bacterium]|nr:SCO family protein [Candidatus Krumholzibacteria bacterium]